MKALKLIVAFAILTLSNLQAAIVDNDSEKQSITNIKIVDGVVYNNSMTTLIICPAVYSKTTLKISSRVNRIEKDALIYCQNLCGIEVDKNNPNYSTLNGVLFDKEMKTLLVYPANKPEKEYSLPSSVETVHEFAFYNCKNLVSLKLNQMIHFPVSNQFSTCKKLTSIEAPSRNKNYTSIDGVLFDKNCTRIIKYPIGKKNSSYRIPESVSIIEDQCFEKNEELSMIMIPNSVTHIGVSAFESCTNLYSITLPKGLQQIGAYGFRNSGLKSIDIPESVTSIGHWAFNPCPELKSITVNWNEPLHDPDTYFPDIEQFTLHVPSSAKQRYQMDFSWQIFKELAIEPFTIDGITYRVRYNLNLEVLKCDSMAEKITIPSEIVHNNITFRVTNINTNAFYAVLYTYNKKGSQTSQKIIPNTHLKRLKIPESIEFLSYGNFQNCLKLERIDVDEKSQRYLSIDGVLYNRDKTALMKYPPCMEGTSYQIPDSVEVIDNDAFWNCNKLKSIGIPNNLKYIGSFAFSSCSELRSIVLPNTVIRIGASAFWGDSSLVAVTLPKNLEEIDHNVFQNCIALKTFTVPKSVKSFGKGVFYNCQNLTTVYLSDSLKKMGIGVFYGCINLKTVSTNKANLTNNLPSTLSTIPDYTFWGCKSLTSITLSNKITKIGNYAFSYCLGLTAPTLPNTVERIGRNAFTGCINLRTMEFPVSVTDIDSSAFLNCRNLNAIIVENPIPFSISNTAFGNVPYGQCTLYVKKESIDAYKKAPIWKNFSTIFETPSNLKSLKIAKAQVSYAENKIDTFTIKDFTYQKSSPTTVSLYKWKINNKYYTKATQLSKVTIPSTITYNNENYKVTAIGYLAFITNDEITQINIPPTITAIHQDLSNCMKLQSIVVDTANTNFASIDGVLFNKSKTKLLKYPKAKSSQLYAIPTSVTEISNKAFSRCSELKAVIIPNSVTTIAAETFYECSGITSIKLPTSIKSIENKAFERCGSLSYINLPQDLREINYSLFTNCLGLKSIILPDSIKSIGASAFMFCINLESIGFPKNLESIETAAFSNCSSLRTITLPKSIQKIGNSTFIDCTNLSEITFLNGETLIEAYAFYKCKNLTKIVLPKSLKIISKNLFDNCIRLSNLTIPESVKIMEDNVFTNCTSMSRLTVLNPTPPSTTKSTFTGIRKYACTLVVPKKSINLYKKANNWKDFTNIVGM